MRNLFVYTFQSGIITNANTIWLRFRDFFYNDLKNRNNLKNRIDALGKEYTEFTNPYFDYGLYLIK